MCRIRDLTQCTDLSCIRGSALDIGDAIKPVGIMVSYNIRIGDRRFWVYYFVVCIFKILLAESMTRSTIHIGAFHTVDFTLQSTQLLQLADHAIHIIHLDTTLAWRWLCDLHSL